MTDQILINVTTYEVVLSEDIARATGELKTYQLLNNKNNYLCLFTLTSNTGFSLVKQESFQYIPSGFTFSIRKDNYHQIIHLASMKVQDFFNSSNLPILTEKKSI